MTTLSLLVASALGAVIRFWFERRSTHKFGQRMPWGTLAANVLGSAMLGWFVGANYSEPITNFAVAFTGAFTTFGGFIGQSVERARHHQTRGLAVWYLLGTVLLSVLAAAAMFEVAS